MELIHVVIQEVEPTVGRREACRAKQMQQTVTGTPFLLSVLEAAHSAPVYAHESSNHHCAWPLVVNALLPLQIRKR